MPPVVESSAILWCSTSEVVYVPLTNADVTVAIGIVLILVVVVWYSSASAGTTQGDGNTRARAVASDAGYASHGLCHDTSRLRARLLVRISATRAAYAALAGAALLVLLTWWQLTTAHPASPSTSAATHASLLLFVATYRVEWLKAVSQFCESVDEK